MDPITLTLLTTFGLKVLEQFKHRSDVVTEEEIVALAEKHYTEAMSVNQQIQEETK
jgi:hypothetical protein